MHRFLLTLSTTVLLLATSSAHAHFLWLSALPENEPTKVQMFFSEEAEPDDPELLDLVKDVTVWSTTPEAGGAAEQISLTRQDDCLEGPIPEARRTAPLVVKQTFGIMERGEAFLIEYYGKAYPFTDAATWKAVSDDALLPFEIVPTLEGGALALQVNWHGKPVSESEVVIIGPGIDEPLTKKTDETGEVAVKLTEGGKFAIRARHVEKTTGEHDGKKYDSIRHFTTLTLQVPSPDAKGSNLISGEDAPASAKNDASPKFTRWETTFDGDAKQSQLVYLHDGGLYAMGGNCSRDIHTTEANAFSEQAFRFDIANRSVEKLSNMPRALRSGTLAVSGDDADPMLHVMGGLAITDGMYA